MCVSVSLWHVTHLPVLRCVVYSIIKSTGRAACRVKVPAASTVAELCTRLCTRFKLDASDAAQAHVALTEGTVVSFLALPLHHFKLILRVVVVDRWSSTVTTGIAE